MIIPGGVVDPDPDPAPYVFFGHPDPDPLLRGTDPAPNPFIIQQNRKKNLDPLFCDFFMTFYLLKMM
jgi:hypothetical protein